MWQTDADPWCTELADSVRGRAQELNAEERLHVRLDAVLEVPFELHGRALELVTLTPEANQPKRRSPDTTRSTGLDNYSDGGLAGRLPEHPSIVPRVGGCGPARAARRSLSCPSAYVEFAAEEKCTYSCDSTEDTAGES